jgi:2-polyprenyl-6-methoxyphenol hydroxylase-like FAD-dependent oxidoreductase
MPAWSRGRVTLVGDAGYCTSPLSGMGTTLAMVGAAALAEAIWRRNQLLKMLITARRLFSR